VQGYETKKNGVRYEIQRDHGLRKRFDTIIKQTDNMKLIHAEKMFGHSTPSIPLDETYADFSVESLFNEYKKAIPELTIDDSQRLKFKNEVQSQKITELEVKTARIDDLERRMRIMEKSKE